MKMKAAYIVCILFVFVSCRKVDRSETINAHNLNLTLDNGVLYYDDVPFQGRLVTRFTDETFKSEIQYFKGRKHGYEKHWFSNGDIKVERYYMKGVKTGIHSAWWKSGNPKFLYYFNAFGAYHGNSKEWYTNGQLYKDFNYDNGKEDGPQRLWKKDGKIKANYEVVSGERFGLIGLKKCYTVTSDSNEIK